MRRIFIAILIFMMPIDIALACRGPFAHSLYDFADPRAAHPDQSKFVDKDVRRKGSEVGFLLGKVVQVLERRVGTTFRIEVLKNYNSREKTGTKFIANAEMGTCDHLRIHEVAKFGLVYKEGEPWLLRAGRQGVGRN